MLDIIGFLNDNIIWGIPMLILMIGTGLYLTVVTKGVIFRHFGILMKYTTATLFKKQDPAEQEEGAITPFQAVCTALSATVGILDADITGPSIPRIFGHGHQVCRVYAGRCLSR